MRLKMKDFLPTLLFILLFGCSQEQPDLKIKYIKAIAFKDADTVTLYNKGIAIETFAYYNPKSDSLFYASTEIPDGHETFTSSLLGTAYRDTFLFVADALTKRKQGNIIDTTFYTRIQPIYVEYKLGDSIYYHYYIDRNDTLNAFGSLFSSLFLRPLIKKTVSDQSLNFEMEAVAAMKNIGEYEKMKEPYIPMTCTNELDKSKIYGSWRSVGDKFNSKEDFMKLTITQTNSIFFELIRNGKVKKSYRPAKFKLISTGKELAIKINDVSRKILSVTDSCLTIEWNNNIEKYNRL